MQRTGFAEQAAAMAPGDGGSQLPSIIANENAGSPSLASCVPDRPGQGRRPGVFVFNSFAEGYIARGKAFTPAKHQAMLAEDLANLPQFLCQSDDVVLLVKRPSSGFLETLRQAGFLPPEFIELTEGRIDPAGSLAQRELGGLRPWAWGPDSVRLLEPLFARVVGETRFANQYFNDDIARLYSKAWGVDFLLKVLARCRGGIATCSLGTEAQSRLGAAAAKRWLCSEEQVGRVVNTLEGALQAIAAIRGRGHHRVVVKEAHGMTGRNTIRLWEPELLPAQRQWLARALSYGGEVVVEPWLERALDFSVQLEMEPCGLRLCGYTGLVNDRKGQFLANWAEADYRRCLPARVAALFRAPTDTAGRLDRLYGEILSWLESDLQRVGYIGPVSIDALVYRTPQGEARLKPVVEINPRYTMGRLTVELMKHACPGSCGLFRLVTRGQARAEGYAGLSSYARSLGERLPMRLEGGSVPGIRQGALCLNDPAEAEVCLATFEVGPALHLPGSLGGREHQQPDEP